MMTWVVRLMPCVVLLALTLVFWRGLALEPDKLPSTRLGRVVPSFSVPALDAPSTTFSSQQLRGNISLVNFWSSWCEACEEEQWFLLKVARDKRWALYGLNYKDTATSALPWLERWGNPYQLSGRDDAGDVAMEFGVYGVPETFLIDANGMIQYRHAGPITPEVWQRVFLPKIVALLGDA